MVGTWPQRIGTPLRELPDISCQRVSLRSDVHREKAVKCRYRKATYQKVTDDIGLTAGVSEKKRREARRSIDSTVGNVLCHGASFI